MNRPNFSYTECFENAQLFRSETPRLENLILDLLDFRATGKVRAIDYTEVQANI